METPQTLPNKARRFWIVISAIYLILLGILLALRFTRVLELEWQGVIRTILVAMLAPSLLILPFAALRVRSPLLTLLLALPLIALVTMTAPSFIPRSQPPIEGEPVLTVLTLNIHQPASREALDEIAAIIRASNADIVTLQELGPSPTERFGPLLASDYPHQSLHTDENYPGSGQGVLSKYPILEEEYWKAGGEWNGNQRVEIDFNGERIVVYNLHPHPPIERGLDPQMESHEKTLLDAHRRAIGEEGAVLMAGDFNMTSEFTAYHIIEASFHDAFREVGDPGFGFTHPHFDGVPLPRFWRIDYVFYDYQRFRGLEAHMLDGSPYTDHFPLLVRLQLVD